MHVCIYVCVCIYVFVYLCVHVCVCACVYRQVIGDHQILSLPYFKNCTYYLWVCEERVDVRLPWQPWGQSEDSWWGLVLSFHLGDL